MAGNKTHDLAVVVREYVNSAGETKKQWCNIGARLEWDDGGASLLIDRHINLAGLPGEGPVRVSMFEPKPKDGFQPAPGQKPYSEYNPRPREQNELDDEIPF